MVCSVDAIQAVGVLPFSVRAIQADFPRPDGHKWLLGPEGLGFFYVRPDMMEQLQPVEFGWHMVADVGNYDRRDWSLAPTRRLTNVAAPICWPAAALNGQHRIIAGGGHGTGGDSGRHQCAVSAGITAGYGRCV